jgi:pimeloyl-ACP methyl ester carboxylesterase
MLGVALRRSGWASFKASGANRRDGGERGIWLESGQSGDVFLRSAWFGQVFGARRGPAWRSADRQGFRFSDWLLGARPQARLPGHVPEQKCANNSQNCFNWFIERHISSNDGEIASIRAMVEKMLRDHNLDRSRVFVTGLSAGGAMACALLASYPDLFAAGAIIAGLPYGAALGPFDAMRAMAFAPGRSSQEWGDLVRQASPEQKKWQAGRPSASQRGFAGPRSNREWRRGFLRATVRSLLRRNGLRIGHAPNNRSEDKRGPRAPRTGRDVPPSSVHGGVKSAGPDDSRRGCPVFSARRKQAMRRAEDPLPTVMYCGPIPIATTPVCGLLRFTAMLAS